SRLPRLVRTPLRLRGRRGVDRNWSKRLCVLCTHGTRTRCYYKNKTIAQQRQRQPQTTAKKQPNEWSELLPSPILLRQPVDEGSRPQSADENTLDELVNTKPSTPHSRQQSTTL
ncbi:unnamed protein product, partial [Ectocarpus sp. 12 AP-2014]